MKYNVPSSQKAPFVHLKIKRAFRNTIAISLQNAQLPSKVINT